MVGKRIQKTAAVYLATVMEYMVAEALEIAGDISVRERRKRITPRHVMNAIRSDTELSAFCGSVIFPESGRPINIQEALLPKKKAAMPRMDIEEDSEEESDGVIMTDGENDDDEDEDPNGPAPNARPVSSQVY